MEQENIQAQINLKQKFIELFTDENIRKLPDGYEDMYDHLDTKKLQPIQDMIDKWIESQGDCGCIYYEDYSLVIELDDLITEIKKEMEEQK